MFESFSQSMSLAKESLSVLSKDKELLVFPLLSGFFTLALLAVIVASWFTLFSETENTVIVYALFFGLYFASSFFVVFFNTALVGAALIRLKGGDPTVSDGLSIAFSRIVGIIAWSIISATIGIILTSLERKSRGNILAQIATGLIGASWALATFFVIPVMVAENVSPFGAIKRSVQIVQQKWGSAVIGRISIGFVFMIIAVTLGLLFAGLFLAVPSLGIAWLALGALAIGFLSVLSSALNSVFVAALYHYATTNNPGLGFEAQSLESALR